MIENFKLKVFRVVPDPPMHRTPRKSFISRGLRYRHRLGRCKRASGLRSSIASTGMPRLRQSE